MTDSTMSAESVPVLGGMALNARLDFRVTSRIDEVESIWATLSARSTLESPGQSAAFVGLWADCLEVPEAERVFVTAMLDGQPLALLPLRRRRVLGVRLLTWFSGRHTGCHAPIVDVARLANLSVAERRNVWRRMVRGLPGDLVYLPAVPHVVSFDELGASISGDILYRAEFSGWEDADRTQRSKSRRKHDRQQGERLDGLGSVTFEEIAGGPEALPILDIMFRQRAARFLAMGVSDPFADRKVRRFYDSTLARDSGVATRLHVLRLNGDVVAVRYNIVAGDRMFCLISSMSDEAAIQVGSPGKQCLLRVMQTVFDAGYTCFDMGAGFTDEKRHWCNVQVPLRLHYLPLTPLGHAAAGYHRLTQWARREIKTNPRLLAAAKKLRGLMSRGKTAPAAPAEEPAGQ